MVPGTQRGLREPGDVGLGVELVGGHGGDGGWGEYGGAVPAPAFAQEADEPKVVSGGADEAGAAGVEPGPAEVREGWAFLQVSAPALLMVIDRESPPLAPNPARIVGTLLDVG